MSALGDRVGLFRRTRADADAKLDTSVELAAKDTASPKSTAGGKRGTRGNSRTRASAPMTNQAAAAVLTALTAEAASSESTEAPSSESKTGVSALETKMETAKSTPKVRTSASKQRSSPRVDSRAAQSRPSAPASEAHYMDQIAFLTKQLTDAQDTNESNAVAHASALSVCEVGISDLQHQLEENYDTFQEREQEMAARFEAIAEKQQETATASVVNLGVTLREKEAELLKQGGMLRDAEAELARQKEIADSTIREFQAVKLHLAKCQAALAQVDDTKLFEKENARLQANMRAAVDVIARFPPEMRHVAMLGATAALMPTAVTSLYPIQ